MKESKFNLFYMVENDKQKILAYNSRSNLLAIMDIEEFENFKNCSITNKYNDLDDVFLNELKRGYFLIDDSVNELEILRYNQQSARYNSTCLGLTIAPTLGCNFNCIYCYEKEHDNFKIMNAETQEALLKFIADQCNTINRLYITWYGGEPLMAFDLIKEFSHKIIKLCNEYNVEYSSCIVTNGYLLSKDIAKEFKDIFIKNVQITLDGPEDIHNKRRFLKNGQGTFEKIINNLKNAIEYIPNISLRINIDKKNYKRIYEIIDLLIENNLQSIYPYLGYVEPTNEIYDKDNCLTIQEFSSIEFEFSNKIYSIFKNTRYPKLVFNNCCADSLNSLVIDPEGNLYKCWSDIGISEYCIGNLFKNLSNKLKIYEYALYDPTMDKKCMECRILPICMGGCPRRRIDNFVSRCSTYKYNLKNYLYKIYEQSLKN